MKRNVLLRVIALVLAVMMLSSVMIACADVIETPNNPDTTAAGVNTDADNQYCGADIEKLVRPILEEKADIVIGERPIDNTEHFSWKKKKFQQLSLIYQ